MSAKPLDQDPQAPDAQQGAPTGGLDATLAGGGSAAEWFGSFSGFGPPDVPGEVGRLGPYRVVRVLGRGSMGAVYAALDTRLDRKLALKVMLPSAAADPSAKARFLREARAAARVTHDNVVTVYEADERDGVTYIAMQYLEGFALDEYLKKKAPPTLPQVVRIAREAAAGLGAAHAHGLIHRDIKPGNLWLEAPTGRVRVLDFGLARPADAATELTKNGEVMGTPTYMSPEQARGERVDHRTDLYSLGALLYRLCAGRPPFNGPTTMAVLLALGTEDPPPVRTLNPRVPEPLAALTHQLLAKNPADRPASAAEVVTRLRAIAQALTPPKSGGPAAAVPQVTAAADRGADVAVNVDGPAPPMTPSARPGRPSGRDGAGVRRPWVLAAAAAAVMAVAGVVILIKNKDGTVTRIEVPDDATVQVNKDGTTVANVGPSPASSASPASPDGDRKAAEYALSLGGVVRVNGSGDDISTGRGKLPKGKVTLTSLNLSKSAVTDEGLATFKTCKALTVLHLGDTRATDDGLANFKGCKALTELSLNGTQVGDAGLASFHGCKGLTLLHLASTKATDEGLANFAGSTGLTYLHLYHTSVGDLGLANFKGCTGLKTLILAGTQVTDAGLADFKGCTDLTWLDVARTPVTDAGLAAFRDCKGLVVLDLSVTATTDAGLALFQGCTGLTALNVSKTSVTAKGVEAFRAAVPGCKVGTD